MSEIDFAKEIKILEEKVNHEIDLLTKNIKKVVNNEEIYYKHLKIRLSFMEWTNEKYHLSFSSMPEVVVQREIVYCKLGHNIGSEQGYKRPVVILQNNIGNKFGNTTIIAPITTYEKSIFTKIDNIWHIEYIENEKIIKRKLDFYEIPVEIEKESKYNITGIVNVVHMREVSKKRLSGIPVAKVTIENFNAIKNAVNKNLDIISN